MPSSCERYGTAGQNAPIVRGRGQAGTSSGHSFSYTGMMLPILVVLGVYLGTLAWNDPGGFWTVDQGGKFLQVQALLRSGYRDFAIPWAGVEVDPLFEYNPLPSPFSAVVNGRIHSVFSPFFALLSSVPFRWLGYWGLYVWPMVGAVLTLTAVAALARSIGAGPRVMALAVGLAGLGSPVWFYSVTFWEHTLSTGLALWAIHQHRAFLASRLRTPLTCGNVLVALAIAFREELYGLWAVLTALTWWRAPGHRKMCVWLSAGTFAAALLPVWLFQWWATGSPIGHRLGAHLTTVEGMIDHLASRIAVFHNQCVSCSPVPWISVVLAMPFLIIFALGLRLSPRWFARLFPLSCLWAAASAWIYLTGLATSPQPIRYLPASANALFVSGPFLLPAFLQLREATDSRDTTPAKVRWLWHVARMYTLLYCLVAPQVGSRGTHWGNRYLLLLYPLLAVPAAVHLTAAWKNGGRRSLGPRITIGALLLTALVAQGISVYILHEKKAFSRRLNREVQENVKERILITDCWWAPQEMHEVFLQKTIFYANAPETLAILIDRLAMRGERIVAWATRQTFPPECPLILKVDGGPLNFVGLHFFRLRARP